MEEKKSPATIPFFVHENDMMHSDTANRRMMIVCLALCITLVIVVVTLVAYYTSRTAIWKELVTDLSDKLVEVANAKGVTIP